MHIDAGHIDAGHIDAGRAGSRPVLTGPADPARAGPRAAAAVRLIAPTPTQHCAALLDAAHRFDASGITEVLDHTVLMHGLPVTIDDVLLPALREIGNRWSRGRCDVAQEHLTTTMIQSWLCQQGQPESPSGTAVLVLSGGPAEQHTVGLEALAALLTHHGLACLNLGAPTPASSIYAALAGTRASAVVLSCQLNANRATTVAALKGVPDPKTALYYAGAGFRTVRSRHGVPGSYLGGSLSQAAELLAARLMP